MAQLADGSFVARSRCGLCQQAALLSERTIGEFPILRCDECGFLQTGKLLNPQTMASYYQSGYGGLRQRQGQEVNATVNIGLLERAGAIEPRSRLLDVGCGYGFLIRRARDRHKATVVGVELAQSELVVARDEFGLDVRASISEVTERDFDVVCLLEVIEHIAEPISFLHHVVEFLKPGGLLCIGTDNFNSRVVASMGERFPKWIPHQHVSLFDERTLPLLIERVGGLAVETRLSFTPWELVAQSALLMVSRGRRGGRVFALEDEVETENSRPYPLFEFRKRLNKQWARASVRGDLSGEMMFIAARKVCT